MEPWFVVLATLINRFPIVAEICVHDDCFLDSGGACRALSDDPVLDGLDISKRHVVTRGVAGSGVSYDRRVQQPSGHCKTTQSVCSLHRTSTTALRSHHSVGTSTQSWRTVRGIVPRAR